MGAIIDLSAYKKSASVSQVYVGVYTPGYLTTTGFISVPPLSTPTSAVALASADCPIRLCPQWPDTISEDAWLSEGVVGGYLTNFSSAAQSVALLIDALVHSGGMSSTVTVEQTIGLPTASLPRYSTGDGVMAAILVHTALGSTATTATINYTNQSGTSGRTSQPTVVRGSANTGSVSTFSLQDGDTGVRSVEGLTLSGSMVSTAGNFGVLLFRPLALLGHTGSDSPDRAPTRDMLFSGGAIVKILGNACLNVLVSPGSQAPKVTAQLRVAMA